MSETKHSLWTRLYRGETSFDFVGKRNRWFLISGTVILIGLVSLLVRGLNFSIDFKGGTVWEVNSTASVAKARNVIGSVDPALRQATIEVLTNRQNGVHTLRISAEANAAKNPTEVTKVSQALADMAHVNINSVTLNTVGPTWGTDITQKAERALVIFLVAVVIYITFRFEAKMAIAALVALLHDILITAGVYSLSGFQVSPATVIAFLTILGYSLYDTVVVFDKIEENTKGLASSQRITYTETVNLSMNQVLMRSINTSTVAIMPILSILVIGVFFLGASALQDFGLALFIGLLTGAYSSIFIASPLLAVMKEREPRYSQIRQRLANRASVASVLTPAAAASGDLAAAMGTSGGGSGSGRGRGDKVTAGAGAARAGGKGGAPGAKAGAAAAGTGAAGASGAKAGASGAKAGAGAVAAPGAKAGGNYEGPIRPGAGKGAKVKTSVPVADEGEDAEYVELGDEDELDAEPVAAAADGKPKAGGSSGSSGGSGGSASGGGSATGGGSASSGGGAASAGGGGGSPSTPRPRPGAANRAGTGGGANRGAPRPRKKGKRR
ncbi:MAG TPA: protein translocase subunit SecF [Acidimicrobiales bacterium]|nr:protein translocase subunit SecF [Acidimicrobiales bacterium]